jgi:hypothetical protein
MLDWTSVFLADGVWAVALLVMAACSLRAWRRMDREAWAPLQWGRDGAPTLRAQRDLAVGFTPMATLAAGLLMAAGARLGGDAPALAAIRLIAPVLLAIAHQAHLASALQTLKVEGGLKR